MPLYVSVLWFAVVYACLEVDNPFWLRNNLLSPKYPTKFRSRQEYACSCIDRVEQKSANP